jgi:uncharacterized protein (DUF58 family)
MNRFETRDALFDPEALSRIGHLELLSQRLVDGLLSGRHRSTHKGGCFEFAEHREYSAGDEIRLIDWRVFARSDRYYVKEFEEETNLQAIMVLDASGSMQFGHSTVSKFDYARIACACLARLMLRQRDSVGLAIIGRTLRQYIPPRSNASHLQALCGALRAAAPADETLLAANLLEAARRVKRRGMFLILSDCFGDREALSRTLHQLQLRGHEAVVLQVLAPEETTFSFSRWSRFECLETAGLRLDLDPTAVRAGYLERFGRFLNELATDCARLGCDYRRLATDRPLGETLAEFLNRRAARARR